MDRRNFIKNTAIAGSAVTLGLSNKVMGQGLVNEELPLWYGFNLQEKFVHKPDEWLPIATEWGANNDPLYESDFEMIKELGVNYVRRLMS